MRGQEVIMEKIKIFFKKILTPVTIILVPHAKTNPIFFKIPFIGIVFAVLLWCAGSLYVISTAVKTIEYYNMKSKLQSITAQFMELQSAIASIKKADEELRKIFSLKSRKDVLEVIAITDTGSIDVEFINEQINKTIETVTEIKRYLSEQKDLYRATPLGWPVKGVISSDYGMRKHPKYGGSNFHSGVDISVPSNTSVKVTADGIVSFAGWTPKGGYTIVVEHGYGFSTAYAHLGKLLVKVGQKVTRGEIIAYSGATGVTTGPHLHYEIWKNKVPIDPLAYLEETF